jgi:hypothetical protein
MEKEEIRVGDKVCFYGNEHDMHLRYFSFGIVTKIHIHLYKIQPVSYHFVHTAERRDNTKWYVPHWDERDRKPRNISKNRTFKYEPHWMTETIRDVDGNSMQGLGCPYIGYEGDY